MDTHHMKDIIQYTDALTEVPAEAAYPAIIHFFDSETEDLVTKVEYVPDEMVWVVS